MWPPHAAPACLHQLGALRHCLSMCSEVSQTARDFSPLVVKGRALHVASACVPSNPGGGGQVEVVKSWALSSTAIRCCWCFRHQRGGWGLCGVYVLLPKYEDGGPMALLAMLRQQCILNSASAIQSSALAVLAVRQQNICCSPAPSTSYSERESGQAILP